MSSGVGSTSLQDASVLPGALASVRTEADVAAWSVASADVAAWSVASADVAPWSVASAIEAAEPTSASDSPVDKVTWGNALTTVAGADAGVASSREPFGAVPWTVTAGGGGAFSSNGSDSDGMQLRPWSLAAEALPHGVVMQLRDR